MSLDLVAIAIQTLHQNQLRPNPKAQTKMLQEGGCFKTVLNGQRQPLPPCSSLGHHGIAGKQKPLLFNEIRLGMGSNETTSAKKLPGSRRSRPAGRDSGRRASMVGFGKTRGMPRFGKFARVRCWRMPRCGSRDIFYTCCARKAPIPSSI